MAKFQHLVELVYDAPLVTDGWSIFLNALSVTTGARAGAIKWMKHDDPQRFRMVDSGLEPQAVKGYGERYGALDTWSRVELAHDADVFGDEFLPRRELEETEFYQDFCRHNGIEDIHKIMLARSPEHQISIGMVKVERVRDPEPERRLTRRLTPHIRRAMALGARLAAAEDERDAMRDALDLGAAAVFFLDQRGKVKRCTAAAEKLLERRDGFVVRRGVLHAERAADDAALAAYLAGAVDSVAAIVHRKSGLAPYRVFLVPRPAGTPDGIASLAIVTEVPESRTAETVLRHGYALTSAELRVAMRVGRGASPKRVAEELEVSWYTVRAQLRTVFAKTGVRRQAELVDLVARLEHS